MTYKVQCQCGKVRLSLNNKPKIHGYCHCDDCRDLLAIPYHSVTAWPENQVTIDQGADHISVFQHPKLKMQKHFCKHCGEVLFNTNSLNWRIVSQQLITRCYDGELPEQLRSNMHFFYQQRVVDIKDDLPKYLRGPSGELFVE